MTELWLYQPFQTNRAGQHMVLCPGVPQVFVLSVGTFLLISEVMEITRHPFPPCFKKA